MTLDVEMQLEPMTLEADMGIMTQGGEAVNESPYIGDNGNWYVWDADTEAYVDTGVTATGPKGDPGEADLSLGMTGAAAGEVPVVSAVDADGKPTAWEPVKLAKADGSNVNADNAATWQANTRTLPGQKVYAKADANGNILAYYDAACTQPITYLAAMGLVDTGNALLIYGYKTYQCVGFREDPSVPGIGSIAVFFRAEHVVDELGNVSLLTETAVLSVMPYLTGEVPAPITITTLTLGGSTIRDTDMAEEMGGGTLLE